MAGRPKGIKNTYKLSRGKRMDKGRVIRPQSVVDAEKIEKAAKREANAEKRAEKQACVAEERERSFQELVETMDDGAFIDIAFERIRENPLWWMGEYVYTYDQFDDTNRIKKFPADRPYFKILVDTILRDKVVFIPKSRQLTTSWFLVALSLWKARFFEHSECYVQCLNEDSVDYFVQNRMQVIYRRLPDWQKFSDTTFSYCKMKMPATGSFASGLPTGEHKSRGRAPACFVSDELAFQENPQAAVGNILPAIGGDGLFVGNSTPNMKNEFHKMCFPKGEKPIEVIIPYPEWPKTRIERYKKHTVICLHYTADPDKRSKDWYEAERARFFAQGKTEEAWEQEYELSFDKTGLPKLYPSYDSAVHEADVEFNPRWPVIVGLDFGYSYPACVFMQHNRETDQIIALDALLLEKCDIDEFAEIVLNYQNMHFKPETDDGIKRHIKYRYFGDHSGTHQRDTGNNAKILRKRHGIGMRSRFSKPEERTQLIRTRLRVRKNGTPGMLVNRKCHLLTEGFRGAFSSKKDLAGNPTGIPYKDGTYDNVHDALGYPIDNLFGVPRSPELVKDRKRRARKRQKELERRYRDSVTGYSPAMA